MNECVMYIYIYINCRQIDMVPYASQLPYSWPYALQLAYSRMPYRWPTAVCPTLGLQPYANSV